MDKARQGVDSPEEIVYSNGLLYISNENKDKLLVADKEGNVVFGFDKIHSPEGIAVNAQGTVYLGLDGGGITMIKKNGEREVIADFYDGLRNTESIVLDKQGNLIVADKKPGCIYKIVPKNKKDSKIWPLR